MDGAVTNRIAKLCVAGGPLPIVEVGAGTGALTRALLANGATVTALEIDPELVALLRERADLGAATILEADALTFDYDAQSGERPWCAAGNLPYNIATPLILHWLELRNPPARIVAMVQRDVAERFTAAPSTPAYGSLTLAIGYSMEVRRAFTLGPASFYPRPKVDSTVVVMERRPVPTVVARDPQFLMQVVRGAFAYRRKTLANSLALALDIPRARTQATLGRLGLDTEIRAEQLDLGKLAALADDLAPERI